MYKTDVQFIGIETDPHKRFFLFFQVVGYGFFGCAALMFFAVFLAPITLNLLLPLTFVFALLATFAAAYSDTIEKEDEAKEREAKLAEEICPACNIRTDGHAPNTDCPNCGNIY